MDEANFLSIVEATLQNLFDQLEDNLADFLHAELEEGVLTISLESGEIYVLNRHVPHRQVWMSSPLSGATHFSYDEKTGQWLSEGEPHTRLHSCLASELSLLTQEPFYFD